MDYFPDNYLLFIDESHSPAGAIHRLANHEQTPLELLGVQIGKDDIVRFEDGYGR